MQLLAMAQRRDAFGFIQIKTRENQTGSEAINMNIVYITV
jgi:hypothetical protein